MTYEGYCDFSCGFCTAPCTGCCDDDAAAATLFSDPTVTCAIVASAGSCDVLISNGYPDTCCASCPVSPPPPPPSAPTQYGITFSQCGGQGAGTIASEANCTAAATAIGLGPATVAGSDWASGCLYHGGGVYFSPYDASSTDNPTVSARANPATT